MDVCGSNRWFAGLSARFSCPYIAAGETALGLNLRFRERQRFVTSAFGDKLSSQSA
jgi:hypothetical protein